MMRFPKYSLVSVMLILGFAMGLMASPAPVTAQDTEEPTAAKTCLQRFGVYLSSLSDFDEFKGYWEDFFVRNRCQQDDVFVLQDDIENRLKDLREEYIEHCASDEIVELQEEIRELKMELHFVRYISPAVEDTSYPDDVEEYEATREVFEGKLFTEMEAKYVLKKEWLTTERLIELWDRWMDSYGDRIQKYQQCTDSPWQRVANEWMELVDKLDMLKNAQSLSERAQEIKEEYQKEKEARNEEANVEAGQEKDGKLKNFKAFIEKHIDINVKNIDKEKTEQEILEEKEALGEVWTVEQFRAEVAAEGDRYTTDELRASMIGSYAARYQNVSAEGVNDLTYRIRELAAIVQNSSNLEVFLPGLKKSAKKIHKKQGAGKP